MINYKSLLGRLGFYVLSTLSSQRDSCICFNVYKTKDRPKIKDSETEVVKFPLSGEHWSDGMFQVGRENEALKRAMGIRGVPIPYELLDLHFNGTRVLALYKQFLPGVPLEQTAQITDPHTMAFLEDTVRSLHVAGIAVNDLAKRRNIVLDERGIPSIIDFGNSVFEDRDGARFENAKKEDRVYLDSLFKAA